MPLYEYERQDGTKFEVIQKFSDAVLERCPTTGQEVKRLISKCNAQFVGTGFYSTDYGHKKPEKKDK